MISSIRFDSTVNAFGDFVNEVFSGNDEEQKAKLGRMFDHFITIRNSEMEKKPVNNILPPEMVEKILKYLNYKDICQSKLICRRWKEIIDNGNLIIKASSKSVKPCSLGFFKAIFCCAKSLKFQSNCIPNQ